jgi:pilus assembly protein TadC
MAILQQKDKNKENEDLLKVLSANIEVINQKLAMTQGYGMEEYHALVEKGLDEINKKQEGMLSLMKSNEMDIRQLIAEDKNKILEQLDNFNKNASKIVQSDTQIINTVTKEILDLKTELREEVAKMVEILQYLVRFNRDWVEYLKQQNPRAGFSQGPKIPDINLSQKVPERKSILSRF